MKFRAVILTAVAGGVLWLHAAEERVPGLPASVKDVSATGFTSEQYYEEPNQQQVKLRFSGASVVPLPGGLQEVREVRIEYFGTNGMTQVLALTPKCELAPFEGVASSAGRLEIRSGDGRFSLAGDGFLLRQNDMTLAISNNVHTVLKIGTNSLFKL
jgi:hypothetical protein